GGIRGLPVISQIPEPATCQAFDVISEKRDEPVPRLCSSELGRVMPEDLPGLQVGDRGERPLFPLEESNSLRIDQDPEQDGWAGSIEPTSPMLDLLGIGELGLGFDQSKGAPIAVHNNEIGLHDWKP